jgi:Exportin-5 family
MSCPAPLYSTHLAPILGPFIEHMVYRLEMTWLPVIADQVSPRAAYTRALSSGDCQAAAALAATGGDAWFAAYYARAGLMVGDLDPISAEAAVEKGRVEVTRNFCDMLQSCLALKGDWALVLAYQAKEEQTLKHSNSNSFKMTAGPKTRPNTAGGPVNADGSPRGEAQAALDARKILRINAMCHFLFLENEAIAGNLTMAVIQCMAYPDAYTCRRVTRICHRILETVAWAPQYTNLLGTRMFTQAVKNIVTEPKWMVGIEWDMINVVRDIYCRLVLGQTLQPGGQGAGQQQNPLPHNPNEFEQAKTVDRPLYGGGILTTPSNLPRQVLAALPGIDMQTIDSLEQNMKNKRSAKAQKDAMRDLLRVAADNLKQIDESRGSNEGGSAAAGIFDRAVEEESLLHHTRRAGSQVEALPEKLVTRSMVEKQYRPQEEPDGPTTLFSV